MQRYLKELNDRTGFGYATYYSSRKALHLSVDFTNTDHIIVWNLLATTRADFDKGVASAKTISQLKYRLQKIFGEYIGVGKYDGADCSVKLTTEETELLVRQGERLPLMNGVDGKWYYPDFTLLLY